MFNLIKRLSGQTLTYGLGHILTRLVPFLLLPVFTNFLPPDQFGVQTLCYIMIAVMMEVIRLGQDIALLRYYVLEKDNKRRKLIFSTVFWGMLFFSMLLAGALWYWDEFWLRLFVLDSEPVKPFMIRIMHLCAAIVFLDNLSAFPLVVMRGENKAWLFQAAKFSGAVVQAVLTVIFLVFMGRGIPGIFEANAISAGVTLLICLPTIISRLKPVFDWAVLKMCLVFGLPNVPNALFVVAIELADRRILSVLRSAAEVGIYSAGYKLGLFLSIVAMGFRFAWQPFFLQISDRPDARVVYSRVLTYYMAITCWLYLLLTAFVEPLAKFNFFGTASLIAPEYWEGLRIFPIVLLAQIFNGAFAVFMVGVYIKKKMLAIPFITGIAAVINVTMNLTLVPQWGMWASAWATVTAYSSMTILLYFYINRHYPISWEWKRLAHLFMLGALTFAVSAIARQFGISWVGYAISIIFPLLLLATGMATSGELERIGLRRKVK